MRTDRNRAARVHRYMYWRWALVTLGQMIPSGQASRHPLALSSTMHWNVALRVGSTASTGDVASTGRYFVPG
jgi:hypothetical protein